MKKIISCIIVAVMMLSMMCVSAQETASNTVSAYYDAETREITINGNFPSVTGKIAVLVSRYDEETLNSYDDLTEENIGANLVQMSIWDGEDSLVLKVKESTAAGFYVVLCSVPGLDNVPYDVFYITDVAEQNAAINAFKTATIATIDSVITTYSITKPVIALPLDNELYTANKADVQEIFVNCIAEEVARQAAANPVETFEMEDVVVCFNKALSLVDFNTAADKAAKLEIYSTLFGISTSADSTTHMAAAANMILNQSEAQNGKIKSVKALNDAFDKAVALCVINSSTRETIKSNLFTYDDVLGFDAEAGYAVAVENKLNSAMTFKDFADAETAKSAFETAVAQNPISSSGGGTLGGGSFGGGSGSSGGGITGGSGSTTVARPTGGDKNETPIESEGIFADIVAYDWAHEAINYLNKEGVLQGVGDGKFEPARGIKREEFAKIMVEAFDLSDNGEAVEFADVEVGAWHYSYVNIAYQHGIITGINDTSFGTGSFVTREQAAAMIYRYLKSTGYEFITDGEDFADSDECSDYAKEAIKALKNSGLVNGNGDNTFCPKDALNRAQAAVMIYNIISEMEAK